MTKREFDLERLIAVLEEPSTSHNAFNEALRRVKQLLGVSK